MRGSATTTTAALSLDPAASRMLEQYMACVAALGGGSVVFKIRRGLEDFSSHPTTPQMCSNNQAHEPRASFALLPSRAVSVSTGVSGKNKGGSPGSRGVNFAPELGVTLLQRVWAQKQRQQ
jgi:hypothetical protein